MSETKLKISQVEGLQEILMKHKTSIKNLEDYSGHEALKLLEVVRVIDEAATTLKEFTEKFFERNRKEIEDLSTRRAE